MLYEKYFVPVGIIYRWTKWALFFSIIFLISSGCKPQSEPSVPPPKSAYSKPVDHQDRVEEKAQNDPNKNTDSNAAKLWTPDDNRSWTEFSSAHDTWDLCFIQGSRVGTVHNRVTPLTLEDGQKGIKIETSSRIQMQRFGQAAQVNFVTESLESPKGMLISFSETMKTGPLSQTTQARVEGNQLQLTSPTGAEKMLTWSPEIGGFNAVEHSLLSQPMTPGERRSLRQIVPMFDTIVTTDLMAKAIEPVELLHGTYRLMRIDTLITLPDGTQMPGAVWTDAKGQTLKVYTKLLNQEIYRVTREEALAKHTPGKLDLGFDMLVKPDRPLEKPHNLERRGERGEEIGGREQSYLVTLEEDDPATVFTSGASQAVEPIDAHSARVTVRAIRPGQGKTTATEAASDSPTMADLSPNDYIQSNHPVIGTMVAEATRGATGDWEKAVAAERYVHDNLAKADYSQVFSSAVETAKSKRGDCSEHAVLLAALGRASGIPSRVVIGLVYSEKLGAFGFHMWNEMYIGDTWIPMDATLGRGGIGVGHLKLGHTTLANGLADSVFFVLPKTLGKLKIKVE